MTRTILALAILTFSAAAVRAQAPPAQTPQPQQGTSQQPAPPAKPQAVPPSEARARIRTTTNVVLVPVTVKDRQGRLVGDLQRNEFRVFDDGIEQEINPFFSDPWPLSVVVLIDNDLSQKQAQQVQRSLTAIAAGLGPSDEAALVTYDQFPNTVVDFTFDNDRIFTSLKRLELSSHMPGSIAGPMAAGPAINGRQQDTGLPTPVTRSEPMDKDLDDALFGAGEMLKGRSRDRRKIIFLISDGNNSRHNQHSFKQTLQLLLSADVSVYSISVGHAFLQHETTRLEKYAGGTGGDTFYAGKALDLERLYSSVTEQARNQYTLAFTPKGADPKKDYHTIEVRVRRADLEVLAREGYYNSASGEPR
ncbi:MAG TPA: VWA domain-containing protein [Candidatus Sulfotelmatobacter sp.]|nr:VWA domain-containing protein [Candidatus Sulfotelmatobacter sp.]